MIDERIWKWRRWWKIRGVYGMRFRTLREAEEYLELLDNPAPEETEGELAADSEYEYTVTVTGTLSPGSPSEGLSPFWSDDISYESGE